VDSAVSIYILERGIQVAIKKQLLQYALLEPPREVIKMRALRSHVSIQKYKIYVIKAPASSI
jgi:hypothetical protein